MVSGSIRENLDPFGAHSDDEIWAVLEMTNLKVLVTGLQGGLQCQLSDNGENLR